MLGNTIKIVNVIFDEPILVDIFYFYYLFINILTLKRSRYVVLPLKLAVKSIPPSLL